MHQTSHTAPALLLFLLCCLSPSVFHVISMRHLVNGVSLPLVSFGLCRHRICVDEASASQLWESRDRVCQSGRGGFLQVASWLYELTDPELPAMYAESQDENTRLAGSSEMSLSRDCSIFSASVTWLLALHVADREACSRSHANEVVVLRVPGPHELSVLPLAASRRVTQPLTSRVQLCYGGLEGGHGVPSAATHNLDAQWRSTR